ncbi:MAG TPA: hypothetical protein VMV48_00170 [Gallionellaceae bacterium]|nr:hypothetical protein [Gallionellaceae bacterium]
MKKIALVGTTLALALAAGSALAANSLNAGTLGLNIPVVTSNSTTNANITTPLISGRYFVAKDVAVLGGFGFNSGGPSGNSTTTFALMGGVRKYLKVDDLAPFVGGFLGYESTSSNPSSSAMTIAVEAGAEYFLAKQFSVEGKVNFGYQSVDNLGAKSTYFGTSTANLGVNFYF